MSSAPSRSDPPPLAVEVRAPSRLHLGMFSFGVPGAREFGGTGVMVDRPVLHVRLRRANRLEARGPDAERALRYARMCFEAWQLGDVGCAIEMLAAPPPHAGLGSGTQLGLAIAAAIRHLFVTQPAALEGQGVSHPLQGELHPSEHEWLFDVRDAIDLARTVGRGRRSCVGVYGFSRGGLIIEAGRKQATGSAAAAETAAREFSPMVARVRLPSAWRCLIVIGRDAAGLHGKAEREAFARLPAVPAEVTSELSRIALLELLPAAVESRFDDFALAVRRYGHLAGAPFAQESEKLPHAQATADLIELLTELGAGGCTQTSWGPAVMACCESLEKAGDLAERLDSLGLGKHHDIVIARFDGQGAVLRVVE